MLPSHGLQGGFTRAMEARLFTGKSHLLFPIKAYKEWGWNNPPNSTGPPKLILNSIYGPEG